MAIEIVDLPINSMVIFHSYVNLPEGILCGWDLNHPQSCKRFMAIFSAPVITRHPE